MKKFITILVLLFAISSQLKAQTLSINAYGGYTFQDKLDFGNAYAYIRDGFTWGVSAEGIGHQGQALELLYQYQSTDMPVYKYNGGVVNPLNSSSNTGVISYLLINGNQYFYTSNDPKVIPYFGAGGGLAFVKVDGGTGSSTGFGWDVKTGVKIKTSSAVAVKIGAQLFSALSQSGGHYYYYPYGYSTFASAYQFSFTAGVTFDFGHK